MTPSIFSTNPYQTLEAMRSALANAYQHRPGRSRSASLTTVPPAETSEDWIPELAAIAATILYKSPLPSQNGLPLYMLNAAAFPDSYEVDYDSLLPYVLARLPGEDELLSGTEYEIVFFAGGQPEGATSARKQGPGVGWYIQAYHVLSRATRKKLQRLYIVHPRGWVKVLIGVFGTIVSPKFRRKVVTLNTLSQLALQLPIENLLIPQAVYLHDRKHSQDIYAPSATGKRAFGALHPLPKNIVTGETRLPRVLREATTFLLMPVNIKTEGLFRVPPHSVLAGVLKEAYDRGQKWIVWKEGDAVVVDPGLDEALLNEIRPEDTYSVHLAASLIKYWYRDLREPIFPESSYEDLRQRYGDASIQVTPEDLVDILLPQSQNSPLTETSREILTRHLLPMLSEVAAHETENRMSPENLAICFAMTMVCGSNQLEDAKMTNIVRRVLQAAIEMWPVLREGMGLSTETFDADLQPPSEANDYEDPLETGRRSNEEYLEVGIDEDGHRIILSDFEDPLTPSGALSNPVSASSRTSAPPLPKRPSSSQGIPWASAQTNGIIPGPAASPPPTSSPAKAKPPPLPARPQSNHYPADPASCYFELPHRKPAPAGPSLPGLDTNVPPTHTTSPPLLDSATTSGPPRYSSVFDADGRSLLNTSSSPSGINSGGLANSPTSVADGFGFAPELRIELGRIGNEDSSPPASHKQQPHLAMKKPPAKYPDEKVGPSTNTTPIGDAAQLPPEFLTVPKRKAVSGSGNELKTWMEETQSTGSSGKEVPGTELGASSLSRETSNVSTSSGRSARSPGEESSSGYWARFAAQRAMGGWKPGPGPGPNTAAAMLDTAGVGHANTAMLVGDGTSDATGTEREGTGGAGSPGPVSNGGEWKGVADEG